MVLGAAERLDALAVLRSGRVDVLRDRRRADEGHGGDVGVLEDSIDGNLVSLHDVEHALGQTRLPEQVGHEQRHRGILFARLQHEGVSGGDGVGEHPHRHHGGEVERGDAGHHTEWLADGEDIDPAGGLLGEVPLHQLRDAAGEFDVLDSSGELAGGVAGHFAVFDRYECGDLVPIGNDELMEVKHDFRPSRQGCRTPRREGLFGGDDGSVDFRHARQADLRLLFTGRGVVDRSKVAGGASHLGVVDPVVDGSQRVSPDSYSCVVCERLDEVLVHAALEVLTVPLAAEVLIVVDDDLAA